MFLTESVKTCNAFHNNDNKVQLLKNNFSIDAYYFYQLDLMSIKTPAFIFEVICFTFCLAHQCSLNQPLELLKK